MSLQEQVELATSGPTPLAKRIETLSAELNQLGGSLVDTSGLSQLATGLQEGPNHEAVSRLKDPAWLISLVAFQPIRRAGAAYILPGLVAWTVLAVTEYFFSRSGSSDLSFFGWWSAQGLFSPMTYSLAVAVCLAWLVLHELRAGWQAHKQHKVEELLVKAAATVAVQATLEGQTPANDLTGAADQLRLAASSLRDLVARFKEAEVGIKQTQDATAKATQAAQSIEIASAALALPADRLSRALEGLQPLLTSWTATKDDVAQTVTRIGSGANTVDARLTQLSQLSETMLETARSHSVTAADLKVLMAANEASQPDLRATVQALRETGDSLLRNQSMLAEMVKHASYLVGLADAAKRENRL